MKNKIQEITHSQYSVYLLDAIFRKPIFTTTDFANQMRIENEIHKITTLNLLRQLKKEDVLIELQPGSGSRAATLCFRDLINLAEGRTAL